MVYILLGITIFEAIIIMNLEKEVHYCKQVAANQKELMKKWWYEDTPGKELQK